MQWEGERESENVEDRRSLTKTGLAVGGGGSILVLIVAFLLGGPQALLDQLQQQGAPQGAPQGDQKAGAPDAPRDPAEEKQVKFVKVVLAETEDVWKAQFQKMGKTYRNPKLVLFSGKVESACGMADAAVGPFYCPGDEHVYLDLAFFREMRERLMKSRYKGAGDFAEAYVIAHEVGHHVQKLMGTSDRVNAKRGRASKAEANRESVRLELQADFLAGVWAHHTNQEKHNLDPADIASALDTAKAIGDDRLQQNARGYVVPDSFTHGTSKQRVKWFTKGFETGDYAQGNTFDIAYEDL